MNLPYTDPNLCPKCHVPYEAVERTLGLSFEIVKLRCPKCGLPGLDLRAEEKTP